jgi:hypothetical protein
MLTSRKDYATGPQKGRPFFFGGGSINGFAGPTGYLAIQPPSTVNTEPVT